MTTQLLPNKSKSQNGFTLIEVMMVISLWAILFAVSVTSLSNLIPKATLDSYKATLMTDLKTQQSKALNSYSESISTGSSFGIYIENARYTLFEGNTFLPNSPENIIVEIDSPVTLSTSFSNNVILFEHISGELINFVNGSNTITFADTASGQQSVITLNQYGVITQTN